MNNTIFLLLACGSFQGYCHNLQMAKLGAVNMELLVSQDDGRKATLTALQQMIKRGEVSTRARARKIAPKHPTKFVADRTVFSDLCMGADQEEHNQIAEGVIVCLLAVSRDASEIPLSRVYVELKDGKTIDLPLLATLPAQAAKTLKTDGSIGKNVWVGLYWAPKARTIRGDLFVDFASKRNHFDPGVVFPLPKSFGKGLEDRNPNELVINFSAMKELIDREYPGMDLAPSFLEEINRSKHQ